MWFLRPVEQITAHPKSDLAIGAASKFIDGRFWEFLVHPKLSLTTQIQQVGDLIATYAYPSTIIEGSKDSQVFSLKKGSGRLLYNTLHIIACSTWKHFLLTKGSSVFKKSPSYMPNSYHASRSATDLFLT